MLFGNGSSNGSSSGTSAVAGVWLGVAGPPLATPLEGPNVSYPMIFGDPGFADGWWDPALRAQLVLADFARVDWRDIAPPPPDNSDTNLGSQIANLLAKRARRGERYAEILAQSDSFIDYWYQLLGIGPGTRTYTATLVQVGIAVGQLVVMHWKYEHKRIRPGHLYPALAPVIATPRHPSYPSGHALQSFLISQMIAMIGTTEQEMLFRADGVVRDLAYRIAENREIAGVHFPDDTYGSLVLADPIAGLLATVPSFIDLLALARQEWKGLRVIGTPPPAARTMP